MKSLVIAEKPSVARDIARVLGCKPKGSVMEGEKYVITWALGHLVTLADPEDYDKKYQKWEMDTLPMLPDQWQLVVIKQTSKQYQTVKTQLYRKDIKDIVIATDAGREGELVARWILDKAQCKKPIKRLWISSVTDKAIREGFDHLADGRAYNNLYAAALCRARADWLVGMNGTRALTCKYNAQLSCGRVQTPTLALIAQRAKEISEFKPEEYFGLNLYAGGIIFSWQDEKSKAYRTFSKDRIQEIQRKVQSESIRITEVKETKKQVFAPGLYDLTQLQREANKKYGYSAKQTLNICQSLYEHHKVLTYPRTDSRFIGEDVAQTIKERLRAINIGPYRKLAGPLIMQQIHTNKSFVDDKKVSDHHAIIPTEQFVMLDKMSVDERRIYDMVVRRFISVLYPSSEYLQSHIAGKAAGETFAAKGRTELRKGWKEVYDFTDEEEDTDLKEQLLPKVKDGMLLSPERVEITTGKTKPPKVYDEGTLLGAMEKYGLGTVATRADIIEKLFHSFMMEKKDNGIVITGKARQLLNLVPEELKSPKMTADWERKLTGISEGRLKADTFMDQIVAYTMEIVEEIKSDTGVFRHDNLTNHKCPVCQKRMLAVNGKQAKMLVCQDRACGYREVVSRLTNARCPNCHKKLEMIEKNQEKTFVCKCGYKERLSAFEKRREKEGRGVSKKDVQRYLNKQRKEASEPVNNAFASALANIKLDQ